ncbi:MAG: PAS domain S-box protein [Ramlibacter sp.]|nr:PAS domain S-box protein [Ramlibacter sp.]
MPSPIVQADLDSHYQQIVDSAVEYAIVTADLDGRITSWSTGARRLLGWSAEEMLGQTLHQFFTPEDVESGQVEREMELAQRDGRANDERWHLRRGGERFWASGEMAPLKTAAGETIGVVKILRDCTEQKQHEGETLRLTDSLRASEERLQLALDVGGMGVWEANLRTGETIWWPGMKRIHGLRLSAPGLSPDAYQDVIYPDDRAHYKKTTEAAMKRSTVFRVEYRIVWADGSVHWVEARGKPILDADGNQVMLTGVCLDVTPRKRVENDLKFLAEASAELAHLSDYQTTLDRIARQAVPVFADWCTVDVLDEDGSLKRVAAAHVDPAKVQLAHELHLRFPPDPRAPTGPWTVLRTGKSEFVREFSREMLEAATTQKDHLGALRAMGLRSLLSVPLSARGKVLGVMSFVTAESRRTYTEDDLTMAEDLARRAGTAIENAKLLRVMQESERAKDVFLATLAHELRNPLAPIWNGLTIIRRLPGEQDRVLQVADIIERQVGQLSRLVEDLLDVSRIGTGKIELKKELTSLKHIIGSAVEISRPHVEAAHHKLSITLTDAPTDVDVDPGRMAQVFSNILNNAAKYTPAGGKIDVVVEAPPEELVVRVRDNGTGIAPDMLGKVFGLFTQVTESAGRRQGGLGIGLSLVDGLVRMHGGRVEARSEGLGRGSEFIVYLPRASRPTLQIPAAAAIRAEKAPGMTGRRILVVDDNVDAAATVAELLSLTGNEVAMVHDGESAVARTREFRPDVVLLDIGLPDIDGYEVARRIRKLEGVRQPTLIALTGWAQQQDKDLAAEAGFDHHWTKPVDPQRLIELSSSERRQRVLVNPTPAP